MKLIRYLFAMFREAISPGPCPKPKRSSVKIATWPADRTSTIPPPPNDGKEYALCLIWNQWAWVELVDPEDEQ